MKALTIYRVNAPTTADGSSISLITTVFGTEEEIECLKKTYAEIIGSGLVQEYDSPIKSRGQVVPDIKDGWRYE